MNPEPLKVQLYCPEELTNEMRLMFMVEQLLTLHPASAADYTGSTYVKPKNRAEVVKWMKQRIERWERQEELDA